jgi:hypothetical protein
VSEGDGRHGREKERVMHRRDVLLGAAGLLVACAAPLNAAEVKDFDAKAFAAAQEAGRSVVVSINAPW